MEKTKSSNHMEIADKMASQLIAEHTFQQQKEIFIGIRNNCVSNLENVANDASQNAEKLATELEQMRNSPNK